MRYTIYEYGDGIDIDVFPAESQDVSKVRAELDILNAYAHKFVKSVKAPLNINNRCITAKGVAGIVQLSKGIEIEIVPKFLNKGSGDDWQSTLYLLSTLSKYGGILPKEKINSSTNYQDSLLDAAGRILASEYLSCNRNMIRKYHRESYCDFSISGDIDFDSVFERNPDGIKQTRIRYDRINSYNAIIKEAMKMTVPFVKDVGTQNILHRAIMALGNQNAARLKKERIPSRDYMWKDIYNLSYDIVSGKASTYAGNGVYSAPGFIVDTWRVWEWLVSVGIKYGCKNNSVILQKCVNWGQKIKDSVIYDVNVYPDITVYTDDSQTDILFLADAKYKSLVNESSGEVERADIYEAYAFCRAVKADKIFLIYPNSNSAGDIAGTVSYCSTYNIENVKIFVIKCAFGCLAEKGGIYAFGNKLFEGVDSILKTYP